MKLITDIDDYSKTKEGKIDDDFPITFCPFCGSEHLLSTGHRDNILKIDRWNNRCNTCKWEFEIFIIEEGKKETKIRFDTKDCKECKKNQGGGINDRIYR